MKLNNLNDINLDNIKVAIFDFDDTLAFHKDREFIEHRKKDNTYWIQAYKNPKIFYEKIEPCIAPEQMQKLVNCCREKHIKMYCLSAMRFSLHSKAKENFIKNNYGKDIEFLSASSQEIKTDVVKLMCEIYNCKLENILFVDDMEDNINNMKNLGIYALTPGDLKGII